MKTAPLPPDEIERRNLIRQLEQMEMVPTDFFDDLLKIAELACGLPVALLCLSASYRDWFKIDQTRHSAEREFCRRRAPFDELQIVTDTLREPRLRDDPAVSGWPSIRFYACIPLRYSAETTIGALCVLGYRPHDDLEERQLTQLRLLARHIVTLIKLRVEKFESHRDFGELVLAKHQLQYRKELLEAILDNEPEGVVILSEANEILQINHAGLNMLEAGSIEELRSLRFDEFIEPEFHPAYRTLQQQVLQGDHQTAAFGITGRQGGQRWLEIHAAPLRDHSSSITRLVAIARDITATKQSQQALRLAARVFSDAQEGIIITDPKGTIIDVNPAFCRITGYARAEVIGQNPRMLQSGKQGREFYAQMWQALLATGCWKGEMWNRKKNGELYAELISINALRDEAGEVINYVALFLDITELRPQADDDQAEATA